MGARTPASTTTTSATEARDTGETEYSLEVRSEFAQLRRRRGAPAPPGGAAAPVRPGRPWGRNVTVIEMTRQEFDGAVDDAIDLIPDELFRAMDNVVILVEEEPPEHAPDLLGLYEGVPLTARDGGWGAGSLPDRIFVYRGPLQRMCAEREELVEEITVTVIHEVAHHFGIDDERLHELGWG